MISNLNILYCKLYFFASLLLLAFAFKKLLNLIPLCSKVMQKLFLNGQDIKSIRLDDIWQTMFISEMQKTLHFCTAW